MADTQKTRDETADRRRSTKMREVVELVILELRGIGVTEEDIETFLSRSRKHWQTTSV
jgi:DNA-binding transcriptional regulator YhcF (GntR family)